MNKLLIGALALSFASCNFLKIKDGRTISNPTTETSESVKLISNKQALTFASSITTADLRKHLFTLASDEFEGRETGEKGQKLAADYLKNFYVKSKISSPLEDNNYFQKVPANFLPNGLKDSENVVAFIKGSEKPEEIIVLSAHYDHEGIKGTEIYNGADDDASGTTALLEIAEAFKLAVNNGYGPKRSILFLHLTAEEKGLYGSKFYVENPIFPLKNTVVDLNIDMVGRVDDIHKDNRDFLYLIGSDKLSTELHNISAAINDKFIKTNIDYRYNDENDPNRYYYRSDHYNFAKHNIPVIFYFNGVHADYHKPTDTADKIQYDLLAKRSKLVFFTAWELANRAERIKVDKK